MTQRQYANLSGESGVVAYEIRDDAIVVKFRDGGRYLYDERTPGTPAVRRMKELAAAGKGLATYINTFVRDRYAQKLD